MTLKQTLAALWSHADAGVRAGQVRFGIRTTKTIGVTAPALHSLAKRIGIDHKLSQELWNTGYLEARMLAALIGDPQRITRRQLQRWAGDFDNWAVCDTCCLYLFRKSAYAYDCAIEWCLREKEYVRRAGYVMIAVLAIHDSHAVDADFLNLFPLLIKGASDDRNFVRKAVNWALRQIGKRNGTLHTEAVNLANFLKTSNSAVARWIATDALRELQSPAVRNRVKRRDRKT